MTSKELRDWRLKRGLSQQDAALLIKVSISTYRAWERGRTPIPAPIVQLIALIE